MPPGTVVRLAFHRSASGWPVCYLQQHQGNAWTGVSLDTMDTWGLASFWWYVGGHTPEAVLVSAIRYLQRAGVAWDGAAVEVVPPGVTMPVEPL
jgi:hypothetical protein